MADKDLISDLQGMINALQESPEKNATASCGDKAARNESLAFTLESSKDSKPFSASADKALDAEAAFKKIIALVNVSDRSEKTIRERLVRAGFDHSSIDEAVAKAKDYRFIDDLRFATVLARSRLSQGKGIYGIERELLQHNITPADVPGWPQEFEASEDDEYGRALAVLEKRPPRSKNLRDGAFRKLVQKGFSISVASEAARTWVDKQEGRI